MNKFDYEIDEEQKTLLKSRLLSSSLQQGQSVSGRSVVLLRRWRATPADENDDSDEDKEILLDPSHPWRRDDGSSPIIIYKKEGDSRPYEALIVEQLLLIPHPWARDLAVKHIGKVSNDYRLFLDSIRALEKLKSAIESDANNYLWDERLALYDALSHDVVWACAAVNQLLSLGENKLVADFIQRLMAPDIGRLDASLFGQDANGSRSPALPRHFVPFSSSIDCPTVPADVAVWPRYLHLLKNLRNWGALKERERAKIVTELAYWCGPIDSESDSSSTEDERLYQEMGLIHGLAKYYAKYISNRLGSADAGPLNHVSWHLATLATTALDVSALFSSESAFRFFDQIVSSEDATSEVVRPVDKLAFESVWRKFSYNPWPFYAITVAPEEHRRAIVAELCRCDQGSRFVQSFLAESKYLIGVIANPSPQLDEFWATFEAVLTVLSDELPELHSSEFLTSISQIRNTIAEGGVSRFISTLPDPSSEFSATVAPMLLQTVDELSPATAEELVALIEDDEWWASLAVDSDQEGTRTRATHMALSQLTYVAKLMPSELQFRLLNALTARFGAGTEQEKGLLSALYISVILGTRMYSHVASPHVARSGLPTDPSFTSVMNSVLKRGKNVGGVGASIAMMISYQLERARSTRSTSP